MNNVDATEGPARVCMVCLDVFRGDTHMRLQRVLPPPNDVPDLERFIQPVIATGNALSCPECTRLLNRPDLTDVRHLRGEGMRRIIEVSHEQGPSQDGLMLIGELAYTGWWRANKDRKAKYGRGAQALFDVFRRYPADPAGDDRPLRYETRASGDARITLSAIGNLLIIIDLWVTEHGRGEGGRVLRDVLAICDDVGAHAAGTVQSHGGSMDESALIAWYKRLGFEEEPRADAGGLTRLVRAPRKAGVPRP